MLRVPRGILGLTLCLCTISACPRDRLRGERPVTQNLPAILWTVQLEGEPWPHGLAGDLLLVYSMRTAEKGFSFPIQISALAPADGTILWSTPGRPWLWDVNVPWSLALGRVDPVLGVWEKGDVLRALRLEDGQDAWSLPECRGVVVWDKALVTTARGAIWLLDPNQGRTVKRHRLSSKPLAPPVRSGDLAVLVQGNGQVQAMDPMTGTVRWERALPGVPPREPGLLMSWGSVVLVALTEPQEPNRGGRLLALRGDSGEPLWEARLPTREPLGSASGLARLHIAGDLVLWPEPGGNCLHALERHSGKTRFRACGLHLGSPATRFENALYALGLDNTSEKALRRGDPWYAIDFPLVVIDVATGKVSPLQVFDHRRTGRSKGRSDAEDSGRPLRATRLPFAPVTDGVIYLLRRNRFLTALRVGFSPPPEPRP